MEIRQKIKLAQFSNYRTGGTADCFVEARNIEDIKSALVWARDNNQRFFILGGGTNILFPDEGYRGLVIKINITGFKADDSKITAGAGVTVADLVKAGVDGELTGLEWAGGLPGTLGGAVRGNAGCFGGEMKDIINGVKTLTPEGELLFFNNQECGFGYRHSRFKTEGLIIVEAVLNLHRDLPKEKLAETVQKNIDYRKERQPWEYPNCGSVFKNVPTEKAPEWVQEKFKAVIKTDPFPVIPTAALIHEAGLKGYTVGGASVSEKHPNFIINAGGATSRNIFDLVYFVKQKIKQEFEVDLEVEIELVDF